MPSLFSSPERITMPPALSPGVCLSPESCQSVLWCVVSSTRTLTCFTAEQHRESKRGEGLEMGAEGRGSERTEHKIPSVLGWMAHFLAWREQLWIQFVPLANCVPESLVGPGKKKKKKNANGWQAYSGSGQHWSNPCWDRLSLAEAGSRRDLYHKNNDQRLLIKHLSTSSFLLFFSSPSLSHTWMKMATLMKKCCVVFFLVQSVFSSPTVEFASWSLKNPFRAS